jgi:hypothetical protein
MALGPADPNCDLCGGRGVEVDMIGDRKACPCRGEDDRIGEWYAKKERERHAAYELVRQAEAETPRDEAKIKRLRRAALNAGYVGD